MTHDRIGFHLPKAGRGMGVQSKQRVSQCGFGSQLNETNAGSVA